MGSPMFGNSHLAHEPEPLWVQFVVPVCVSDRWSMPWQAWASTAARGGTYSGLQGLELGVYGFRGFRASGLGVYRV